MSPQQTRISAKKSSSIPIGPKYTPAPVLQPKATKKPEQQLPEWQPEGGGMVSPLQRLLDTNAVQAKLTIGEPNDKYEQEADAVAQDVVQRLHSPVSETPPETAVQRETEAGKHQLQRKAILQRTHAVGGEAASPDLEGSINRAKGGGQPLDTGLQRSMSQAMGADFSGVRVHTDSHADQLNQSIQAKAFTTGQDVFFRQGAYDPGSRGGQELIAHELTHVVQQNHSLGSSQNITNVSRKTHIQRFTPLDKDDWSRDRAAYFMMNKQKGLANQNIANASIWYNTMFSPGLDPKDPNYDREQERVLREQQAMLKRHFLAQAVFGVEGGTQSDGKKAENYKPIEEFQQDGVSANLATLASGGGRFNYRSTDGSGDAFNKFLMFGSSLNAQTLDKARDTNNSSQGGLMRTSPLGAYKRIGTHGESFANGQIQEVDKTTGGIDSTGFDIPIGGVGLTLHDQKGRPVTTGYQGISKAKRRGKHIRDDYKTYQTGHGFHRYAKDGMRSLTQIAFEGSAPRMDNIHGGSHGVFATIGKKLFGGQSEKTLTGQDKRSKLGLPSKIGGIKADVTKENLAKLEEVNNILERMRGTNNESLREQFQTIEQQFYQGLLASTTAEERNNWIQGLIEYGKKYENDL